ncbi:hypothetical protein V8C86DRAFT_1215418 [Haematococcus lacustris]
MSGVLAAVNRIRKIEECTSSKDDVPPVYLMDEISEMAKEGQDAAQSVAEHISRNLGNRSPVVKWKALKLVKHLCSKGCIQFQRSMQKHASSIRELVHYKGEPDPFRGDTLNQRVRDLAKETLDLLYNSQSVPTSAPALQGRIQGFGSSMAPPPSLSSSNNGSSGSKVAGNGRMMAFGSSNPPASSWGTSSSGNGHSSSSSSSSRGYMGNQQTAPSSQGPFGSNGHPTSSRGLSSSSGSPTSLLAPGSMRADDTGFSTGLTASYRASGGSFGPPSGSAAAAGGGFPGSRLTPSTVLGTEEALVDDISTAGGVRPAPSEQDLRQFVEAASSMDGLRIAELMMKKLASPQWLVVLRTLCALEAVLAQGLTQACGEIAVMFQSDPGAVRAALASPHAPLRQQAAKCLKLLVGEEGEFTSASAASQQAAGAAVGGGVGPVYPDPLMDLMGGEVAAVPLTAPAAAAAPATAQGGVANKGAAPSLDDLLGDLAAAVPTPAIPTSTPSAHAAPAPFPAFFPPPTPPAIGLQPGGAANTAGVAYGAWQGAGGQQAAPVFDPFGPLTASGSPGQAAAHPPPPAPLPPMGTPQAPRPATTTTTPAPLDDFFSTLTVAAGGQVQWAGGSATQPAPLGVPQANLQAGRPVGGAAGLGGQGALWPGLGLGAAQGPGAGAGWGQPGAGGVQGPGVGPGPQPWTPGWPSGPAAAPGAAKQAMGPVLGGKAPPADTFDFVQSAFK